MSALKTSELTVNPVKPVFKSEALNNITNDIYTAVLDTMEAVDNGIKKVSISLATVSENPDMLKADGFKTVKDYGAALGFKDSTTYMLCTSGRLYINPELSDVVKELPPSKIRELSPVLKKGSPDTLKALNNDAEKVVNMTQTELRDYTADALSLTAAGRLTGDNASVFNPDELPDSADNLPAKPERPGKPEKVYTLTRLSGDNKLSLPGTDGAPYVLNVEGLEPDSVNGWKDYFKSIGVKMFNAGQSDLELPDGSRPVRYILLTPFNDCAVFALTPVKVEPVHASVVAISSEEMQALAAKLAAGEITYNDFEAAIKGNK